MRHEVAQVGAFPLFLTAPLNLLESFSPKCKSSVSQCRPASWGHMSIHVLVQRQPSYHSRFSTRAAAAPAAQVIGPPFTERVRRDNPRDQPNSP